MSSPNNNNNDDDEIVATQQSAAPAAQREENQESETQAGVATTVQEEETQDTNLPVAARDGAASADSKEAAEEEEDDKYYLFKSQKGDNGPLAILCERHSEVFQGWTLVTVGNDGSSQMAYVPKKLLMPQLVEDLCENHYNDMKQKALKRARDLGEMTKVADAALAGMADGNAEVVVEKRKRKRAEGQSNAASVEVSRKCRRLQKRLGTAEDSLQVIASKVPGLMNSIRSLVPDTEDNRVVRDGILEDLEAIGTCADEALVADGNGLSNSDLTKNEWALSKGPPVGQKGYPRASRAVPYGTADDDGSADDDDRKPAADATTGHNNI